jgi:hypothetical protein
LTLWLCTQPADVIPSGPSTVGFEPSHNESHARAISDDGYVSRSGATSSPTLFGPGPVDIQDLLDHDWNASGDHHLELYYKHFPTMAMSGTLSDCIWEVCQGWGAGVDETQKSVCNMAKSPALRCSGL